MKEIIEKLSDGSIVVCSNNIKKSILETLFEEKKMLSVKFKSFSVFKDEILGFYTLKAKLSLAKEEVTYDLAEMKLANSYFVNEESDNNKLNNLLEIKNKYMNNDEYFNFSREAYDSYKEKNVIIIEPSSNDDLLQMAIKKISKICDIKTLYLPLKKHLPLEETKIYIQEFDTIKDEAFYLAKVISQKLYEGASYNNLKINIPNSSYYPFLKEAFSLYHIDIDLHQDVTMIEVGHVKKFLEEIKMNMDMNALSAFNLALDKIGDFENRNLLINMLNKYTVLNLKVSDIYDSLVYTFKNTKISFKKYDNCIHFVDLTNEVISENDILYFIGFNQDILPKVYKDDDYLSDEEKEKLSLSTSTIKNANEKMLLMRTLEHGNIIYISYAKRSTEENLVRSSFLVDIKGKYKCKENYYTDNYLDSYSKSFAQNDYIKEKDIYDKYNIVSPKFLAYSNIFSNIKRYEHKFTGILDEYAPKELNLSYTSIDTYFECPFQYYLERVLKITKENNEEALYIGNLFHHCLMELLKVDLCENEVKDYLDKVITKYLVDENITLRNKQKVFLDIYKDILIDNYKFLLHQKDNCDFDIVGLEKECKIKYTKDIDVHLVGKIDKVLVLNKSDKRYAIVIDYKTGKPDYSFNNVIYGLNMQLLIYYLFLNNESRTSFGGAYLAKVLPANPFSYKNDKSYSQQLFEYFRLEGYSNKSLSILYQIDKNLGMSDSFLSGLVINANGSLGKKSMNKVLDEDEFNKILKICEDKVNYAIDSIIEAKFDIAPKRIGDKETCEYCPYKDICYKDNDDINEVNEIKDLSFIRGGKNE